MVHRVVGPWRQSKPSDFIVYSKGGESLICKVNPHGICIWFIDQLVLGVSQIPSLKCNFKNDELSSDMGQCDFHQRCGWMGPNRYVLKMMPISPIISSYVALLR
ncbi:MAG: hypothetical protein EZS28_000990 [Streblomastix strix]|uniref:Uncharacterized protein n=1 Tax=Streblomastix strix TaxID=222440 RepID=A0A5J4X8J2_9EUKA|nr:MAG: hypothetical protein EZS28_000990 [Streblomastix strix]